MKLYFMATALCITLSFASTSFAVLVTMPSAEILNKRLNKNGFEHFVEKSKIGNQLAGRQLEAPGILMAVELALFDYVQDLRNPMMSGMMQMRKPNLLEALLKHAPEALAQLKELKLY